MSLSDPTPVEECCWPSPAQVLHRWENYTDEQRLEAATRYLEAMQTANECLTLDHHGALAYVRTHVCERSESAEIEARDEQIEELRKDRDDAYQALLTAQGVIRELVHESQ